MCLSDRDILWAIDKGSLIVSPQSKVDPTSVDLHLDRVEEAKVWDTAKFAQQNSNAGIDEPELYLGKFKFGKFAEDYLVSPPAYNPEDKETPVCLRGRQVIVRPG